MVSGEHESLFPDCGVDGFRSERVIGRSGFLENASRHVIHARVHHVFIEHTDELGAADGLQEILEAAEGGLVAIANGDPEPAERDFIIRR